MYFECGPYFVWCVVAPPLLALDSIKAHLNDLGEGNRQDLFGGVQVFCVHCFLIIFDLGDESFEVSLAIDLCLQLCVNDLDILIFEHTISGIQVCEDIQATHCCIFRVTVSKGP